MVNEENALNEENTLNEPNTPAPDKQQHSGRYLMLGVLIITLVAAIYFGSFIRETEPDFYAPGRTAIVNARMHFEESLGYEQALIEQQRMAHDEINQAISHLDKAETLDPADRDKIQQIRAQLTVLESLDRQRENSPQQLQKQYYDLLDQMDALINKLENHAQ